MMLGAPVRLISETGAAHYRRVFSDEVRNGHMANFASAQCRVVSLAALCAFLSLAGGAEHTTCNGLTAPDRLRCSFVHSFR